MYCRYCGAPVPDGANYCQECGRPLLDGAAPQASSPMGPAPEAAKNGSNTVLYLLMALLVLPQLFSALFPVLLFFDEELLFLDLAEVVRALAISAVGVVSVLSLVRRGWILPGQLRGRDLLMWALWSILAGLISEFSLIGATAGLGDDAALGYAMARDAEESFCGLYGFWSWALLILLCLARSDRLRLTKKVILRAGALLAGWSLLFLVLSGPIFTLTTGGAGAFS